MLCEQGGAVDSFDSGATWGDGTPTVNMSGGESNRRHIAATGIDHIREVCHHLRAKPASPDPR